jgi:hypothetical protein
MATRGIAPHKIHGDVSCVNPLSWRADSERVPRARNPGCVTGNFLATRAAAAVPGLVDAQCEGGALWVTPHAAIDGIDQPGGRGDYHQERQ